MRATREKLICELSERSDRECSLIRYYIARTIDSVPLPFVVGYFALFRVPFFNLLSSIIPDRIICQNCLIILVVNIV